jgi:hypothetical protein
MYSWGINDAFAVCAVVDVLEKRPNGAGRRGWGFSTNGMVSLGLNPTVYLGDGAYETHYRGFRKYLALLGADECRSMLK